MMHNFPAFKDSRIIPFRRPPPVFAPLRERLGEPKRPKNSARPPSEVSLCLSRRQKPRDGLIPRLLRHFVSVLVGQSYEARNVLSYTKHMTKHFLTFRDSPIITLRRSPFHPFRPAPRICEASCPNRFPPPPSSAPSPST